MEKFSEAAEFAWGYTREKIAEAIIKLTCSFEEDPFCGWEDDGET